jgi:hypothetical protein
VFTARYALSPYIKQIRFVFKGLSFSIAQSNKHFTSSEGLLFEFHENRAICLASNAGPSNSQLAGNMSPATQCCFARGDIQNEKTVFNPCTWQSRDKTPKQFWKLASCVFMETYEYINHLFCRNVLNISSPEPTLCSAFFANFFYYQYFFFFAQVKLYVWLYAYLHTLHSACWTSCCNAPVLCVFQQTINTCPSTVPGQHRRALRGGDGTQCRL